MPRRLEDCVDPLCSWAFGLVQCPDGRWESDTEPSSKIPMIRGPRLISIFNIVRNETATAL
jgi:hypothetical protein